MIPRQCTSRYKCRVVVRSRRPLIGSLRDSHPLECLQLAATRCHGRTTATLMQTACLLPTAVHITQHARECFTTDHRLGRCAAGMHEAMCLIWHSQDPSTHSCNNTLPYWIWTSPVGSPAHVNELALHCAAITKRSAPFGLLQYGNFVV